MDQRDINLYLEVIMEGLDEELANKGFYEVPTICFDDGVIQVESENEVVLEDGNLFVKHCPVMTVFEYTEDMEVGKEETYMAPTVEEVAAIRSKLSNAKLTAAVVGCDIQAEQAFKAAKVKSARVIIRAEGFDDVEVPSEFFVLEVNW